MFRAITIAALAAAVPSTPLLAQAMSGNTFIAKAGASDLYEKESSRILLQSTHDPRLRNYATQMIRDHSKTTADVKAAAGRSHLRAGPPRLDAMQSRMIAELRRTPAARRDRVYVEQQKRSHAMALQLHEGYAANGQVPALKRVASAAVPIVRHHAEEIGRM